MIEVGLLDWGVVPYGEALVRQRGLFDELIEKRERAGWLVLCEHPHVYTIGKSGRKENLLVGEEFLRARGAELHRVERGGDITYHGPGQIVGYPILDLERVGLGLREYIEAVEQSVIETVAEFGIEAGRVAGKTGVWVGGARKICAIGVRASRGVVMHGFALNVTTDLEWFGLINPCGMADGAVASIEKEMERAVNRGTKHERRPLADYALQGQGSPKGNFGPPTPLVQPARMRGNKGLMAEVKRVLREKLEKNMNINIKNHADRKTMGCPPTG